ncbi:hypothetical protein NC796_10585 [Aliifodinibius sp. S!AR15-10]|uniref:hypothetical protein n=1 Tax=Aliifodinibius sp. S!AR15-10 TaxID=2950437 RepID=UPI002864BFA7|nr:hypothetical protein [Aliifodinibius sp. S!AR15-10]MDR8391589.1 hypothetical protein [Aliifodinibius sp. S!AR15-10]
MKRSIPFLFFIFLSLLLISGCDQPVGLQTITTPASSPSMLPFLTKDNSGSLYLSWVESDSNGETLLKYAKYSNSRWTSPKQIAKGSDWFVNWADYPAVVTSDSDLMAAHWLHKVPGGTYAYDIKMAVSNHSGGQSVLSPHYDETATEHGFVSMAALNNDKFLAVWLDGRQTADRAPDEYGDLAKAMTLRSAEINRDGEVTGKRQIDDSVCDCCQTSLAKIKKGAIVAYRNRTERELRDIHVSRYRQGSWSEPVAVHADGWKIGGCPVNGPVVKASGDTVLVAWYTAANESKTVKAAYSFDGGATFASPVIINDEAEPLGRVDAGFLTPDLAAITWMGKRGDEAILKVRTLQTATGRTGKVTDITVMSLDRKSGFPQIEYLGNTLFFAWTALEEQPQIKMGSISLESVIGN